MTLTKNPRALAMIVLGGCALWAAFSLIHLIGYLAGGAAEPARVLAKMILPLIVLAGAIIVAAKLLGRNPSATSALGLTLGAIETPHSKARTTITPGYRPPVSLKNYFDTTVEKGTQRQHIGKHFDFRNFTDDAVLLAERSAMPQFRLWYYSHDYVAGQEKEKTADRAEWVQVTDGNPRLGTDVSQMPIFLQIPVPSNRPDPHDRKSKLTELVLFEITPEQVERLTTGPLRRESFDLVAHTTGEVLKATLGVGVRGGRFREAVKPTDAHGTAQPVGLGNMDPAPDPHGSAQAGGLGDMHLS